MPHSLNPTPTIDTVVFDLGNVLIPWNPEWLYEKLIPDADPRRFFMQTVCPLSWHTRQDAGYPIAQATKERIALFPEYADLIHAYYDQWDEMIGKEPIAGSVALLRELKSAGFRLYALTNFSDELFPRAWQQFDFLHWFEGIVVSGREKLIKPDLAIYQVLFERHAIEPQHSIFIDDSLSNVEASNALSMQAVHFLSAEQLRVELRNCGLPV